MAGAGYKLFNTGDVLTAQQVNEYLMQQTVMVFADASARTTALSGVLAEGMLSYLKSTDSTEVYNGSAWVALAADQTPLTTKGDLFTYTTADARLASSNVNGDVLTVDTSTASGLKWAAPAASGGMTLIQEVIPSAASAIDFSSISGSYKQLMLVWAHLNHSAVGTRFDIRFNNDSASNYGRFIMGRNGTAFDYTSGTNTDAFEGGGKPAFGQSVTSTVITDTIRGQLLIDNYASTTRHKAYFGSYAFWNSASSIALQWNGYGHYASTSAITSINIYRNVGTATISAQTGGYVRLYGIS